MNTNQQDNYEQKSDFNIHATDSPIMRWLNPVLIDIGENSITMKYLVRDDMTNPFKLLHGGISALIIDDAIGATMMWFNQGYFFATINNTIDYKASANIGDELIAITNITDNHSRIAIAQCEIWNSDMSKLIEKWISKLLKRKN